jgi:undecaprenyl-diphosphatase
MSLHVGTAVAVLACFWREWLQLVREVIKGILTGDPFGNKHRRLAWYLAAGTLPAVVMGLAFEHAIEQKLRSPILTVVTLTVFGLVLYAGERRSKQTRSMDDFTLADSIWVGLSQAVALIPGVSRSGVTISTALFRDADRASAARFSFLLSTPVIVGAGLLEAGRLLGGAVQSAEQGTAGPTWAVLAAGIAAASVSGFLCIRYFLRYLQTGVSSRSLFIAGLWPSWCWSAICDTSLSAAVRSQILDPDRLRLRVLAGAACLRSWILARIS